MTMERYDPTTEAISPVNRALINRVCPANRGVTKWMPADLDRLLDAARREACAAELDGAREGLKSAFVAGCCAVLTWTNSGMPQDDLDEAGYDYATSVMKP